MTAARRADWRAGVLNPRDRAGPGRAMPGALRAGRAPGEEGTGPGLEGQRQRRLRETTGFSKNATKKYKRCLPGHSVVERVDRAF